MRVLTTGALSGLGRHIYERFGGIGWTRQLPAGEREEINERGVDMIIHCASNSRSSPDSATLYDYIRDNVFLTKRLVAIPHEKFVYVSTVDVYPKQLDRCVEDQLINVNSISSIYGITKLISEAIVRRHCADYLILRCAALLGQHSRKNSLRRIVEDDHCRLTLSGDSTFNYILHSDVSNFIGFAARHGLNGIYNVACSQNVSLSDVADIVGNKVEFGEYIYDVGHIDNQKISSIFPTFSKTSVETVKQFVGMELQND